MSFKPEARVGTDPNFYGNSLVFATREEAQGNVEDLAKRWTLVTETRVVESNEPVNYAWVDGKLLTIEEHRKQQESS